MKVRMAQEKDIERIHSLLAQVAMVHHKGRPDLFKAGKSKYTDEELKVLLRDTSRPILAAVDENDCMQGYAFCIFQQYKDHNIMTDIKTLYIDDLCVDETMRGHHIGRMLYEAALDFAREHGCYNLTLNVWSCNESAMNFYQSCGLKPQKVGMEIIL
ncbi:GNAT family N-acetyltransferase [Blautia sp. An46]|uniref:GNAT family N-acetyltransferase n=1 Tax=Blautia sp. An46 TaxID=1965636 RepID=UPI000B37B73B|nr:GNAT family N-acetyltransferase [Blautia sp. An46]OUN95026.1 GNAT family N-acetyltransferase [Blautia sp. An46]